MTYALLFAVLAVVVAAQAWSGALPAPVAVWLGIGLLVLSFAYLRNRTALLGKRVDGRLAWWSYVVHGPYLLVTAGMWFVLRLASREHAYDTVTPWLVIGRRLGAREQAAGGELWVDLTAEFGEPRAFRQRPGYVSFPILDASWPDADALDTLLTRCRLQSVYVHCAQGHGRTGTVAAAMLVARGEAHTVDDAVEMLRASRPALRLSRAQRKWLCAFVDRRESESMTQDEVQLDREASQLGWLELSGHERAGLGEELARELASGHVLEHELETVQALASRKDNDDVLFALSDGRVAVVHLTWSKESSAEFPHTVLFDSQRAWLAAERGDDRQQRDS